MPRGKKGIGAPKGGRPIPVIDFAQVEELAAIQCTRSEICAVLNIAISTLANRAKTDAQLAAAIARGKERGKASIRRQQYKLLTEGNATMGVWLGKQYLDQRDKSDYRHADADGGSIVDALRKVIQGKT